MADDDAAEVSKAKRKHKAAHLTERSIERMRLPAHGKQLVLFDASQRGLVLKVSYGGAKTFSAVHYPNGGAARYFKLGNFHPEGVGGDEYPDPSTGAELPKDLTLAGARRAALLFRSKPSAFLSPPKIVAPQSFKAVAERYLKEEAADFRSKPELERCLKKYAYPVLEDRPFIDIKRSEVIALRSDVAENHGPRMAETVFAIVRSIMRWYEAEGDHDEYTCPIKSKRRRRHGQRVAGKRRSGRTRILGAEEIKLVWAAAGKLGPYGAMIRLLLLTGQRRDKVATMRRADLDGDVWTIATEDFEKGNGGMLRLPPLAMAIIKDIQKVPGCSFVFAGRYGDKSFNSFSQGAEEIRELLPSDMPRWTLHDLRRTSRTLMTDLRIDDRVAEMVIGHAIEGVEADYNMSEYFEQKSEALTTLARYIETLVDPASTNIVALRKRKSRNREAKAVSA